MPVRKGVCALLVGMLIAAAAQVTWAAIITVNTTADSLTGGDGQCTLREALANVNAAADTTSGDCATGTGAGDTITFDLTLPPMSKSATIKLTLGELVIDRDVNITGPTAGWLHVSGERISRVFNISGGATASVSDLTIEKGRPLLGGGLELGGAILNKGTLTLGRCTLANNKALIGGAIRNGIGGIVAGTMTLMNCTLKNNRAVENGGGIANSSGTMTLTDCTLAGNTTSGLGGGDVGGAIANGGAMTLINSTLKGNTASHGGGIYNNGTMTLTDCTLTRNHGRWGAGGAVMNLSALTLTNCTISRNRAYAGRNSLGGGGIWQNSELSPATIIVTNTIITSNGKAGNCGGDRPTSDGHNLDSDGTCFTGGGTDLVNTDPLLAPLLDNYGGPTKTLATMRRAGDSASLVHRCQPGDRCRRRRRHRPTTQPHHRSARPAAPLRSTRGYRRV